MKMYHQDQQRIGEAKKLQSLSLKINVLQFDDDSGPSRNYALSAR
jgi:hypothetical protein